MLLLAPTLEPLNVISARRLVLLMARGKIAFLVANDELDVFTALDDRRLPDDVHIVQLNRMVRLPRRAPHPTRRNILLRDDSACQYCGLRGLPKDMTVDHINPLSRGGTSTWDNMVIACRRCNGRKANRRPEELGMTLLRRPVAIVANRSALLFLRYPELKAAYDAFCAA